MNYLSQQPIFYSTAFNKKLDIGPSFLPKELKVAMVADPAEAFGPRAVDVGARPPGGFGSVPWFSKAFGFNNAFWDILTVIGLASALGEELFAIAFLIVFGVVWGLRQLEWVSERRRVGMMCGIPDQLVK